MHPTFAAGIAPSTRSTTTNVVPGVSPAPVGITLSGSDIFSSSSGSSDKSIVTVTSSSICSSIVFKQLYWNTTWLSYMCFTQVMTYSVSRSVNSTGMLLLCRGPSEANSGMALSISSYRSFGFGALVEPPMAAAIIAPLDFTSSSAFFTGATGTDDSSNGASSGPARYFCSVCSRFAGPNGKPSATRPPSPPSALRSSGAPSIFKYSVARSRTSSSVSCSVRRNSTRMRGLRSGHAAPIFASALTAAARTVAFSRMTRL
mmetsp:Transcript_11670/g.29475  ORF Transcript_11670/g.29475 Transcript_11670/m.29475 type:complete len:259 (+) Transcript_11670:979-1755(+)